MATSSVFMDITKMQKLVEQLKTRATIQVGVFANKTTRTSGKMTNAALAQIHELGSLEHNLPARSMLKIPIHDHAAEIMKPFKGQADAYLAKGTLLNLYKLIGVACENVVQGAFKTGGYGKWAPLKETTLWRKLLRQSKGSYSKVLKKIFEIQSGEVGQGILIDKGELKRSFSSRVRMQF